MKRVKDNEHDVNLFKKLISDAICQEYGWTDGRKLASGNKIFEKLFPGTFEHTSIII